MNKIVDRVVTERIEGCSGRLGAWGRGNRSHLDFGAMPNLDFDYFADLADPVSSILTTPSATLDIDIDPRRSSCRLAASDVLT